MSSSRDGTNELRMMGDRLGDGNGSSLLDISQATLSGDRANLITNERPKRTVVVLVCQ